MKVFITGIAGFIGFHLARSLKKQGFEVDGLDNFSPYYSIALKEARQKILLEEGIFVKKADIADLSQISSLFEKKNYTHLIHLAAQAGVRYSLKDPESYIQTNVVGFFNILEVCKKFSQMKLVYASSSSVYGENQKVPFSEKDQTEKPSSLYAATKKSNELMAYSYHHLYKIPAIGLRFFTVYGPWGRPDMAYYSFTKAILEKKPIELYNFGNVKRDFTYIDDIVSGIQKAMNQEGNAEIYNLGNSTPIFVKEMIEILESLLKAKAIIQLKPLAPGDMKETYADLSSSSKKLGFYPTTSLKKGLELFTQWYSNENTGF